MQLCNATLHYAINFEILFRTITIYLKEVQVKDVHEGERANKRLAQCGKDDMLSPSKQNRTKYYKLKHGILILENFLQKSGIVIVIV